MKVEPIHRPTEHHYGPRIRCQCLLNNACEIKAAVKRGVKYGRNQPARCTRDSVYSIDGVNLCAQHAGKIALDFIISENRNG